MWASGFCSVIEKEKGTIIMQKPSEKEISEGNQSLVSHVTVGDFNHNTTGVCLKWKKKKSRTIKKGCGVMKIKLK